MIELKNVPKKIYLQMTETEMFGDFLEHDVTWSEDRINDSDIEYVRVQPDPVKDQMLEALKHQLEKYKSAYPYSWTHLNDTQEMIKAIEAAEKEEV